MVTVSVTGTGGGEYSSNYGVYITGKGSRITSAGGAVSIQGTGGGSGFGALTPSGGSDNYGVFVENGGEVTPDNGGALTIIANGGKPVQGGSSNYGLRISGTGARISSAGDVSITATPGNSGSSAIVTDDGSLISSSGTANLFITSNGPAELSGDIKSNGSITLTSSGNVTQFAGTIQTAGGTLLLNAPGKGVTFGSLGNQAEQLVVPMNVTAIVNGSFDSAGFVQVDGILSGSGSVGTVTVSNTGRVKPGGGNLGRLTTANVVFNFGSVFEVQLNTTKYGQLAVNGTVNLGGATLQAAATFNVGLVFRIIDNLGSGDVTGTFAGYAEGDHLVSGTSDLVLRYHDGTGNDVTLSPPPVVSSVIFGDGTSQRSMIKQMIVNFSQPVIFVGDVVDAFTLFRHGTGNPTGNIALAAIPVTGPTSVVTLTFSGALTEFGSLIDGFYDLIIDASKVSARDGGLDGNANGTAGDNYSIIGTSGNRFFRFFGDSDGSAKVTMTDSAALRAVFNLPGSVFDFDNSGIVDLADFAQFRARFNLSP